MFLCSAFEHPEQRVSVTYMVKLITRIVTEAPVMRETGITGDNFDDSSSSEALAGALFQESDREDIALFFGMALVRI